MTKSINAYNNTERVRRYDTDMDLLHPNRHKMAEVAFDVLPYDPSYKPAALDLGIGTGFFTSKFLQKYPKATVIGADGSDAMIRLAGTRLHERKNDVRLVTTTFEDIDCAGIDRESLDVVFSSYALHHLPPASKRRVLDAAVNWLKPGGWFFNADMVSSEHADIEKVIRTIRARGIESRNAGADPRFADMATILAFIAGLEESEGDHPLTIEDDLDLLRRAGITNATVFWQEYREVVYGGFKTATI
jgi:ubiquinone/menaquinone biosynthesis C-methylase UbiE